VSYRKSRVFPALSASGTMHISGSNTAN